MNDQGFEGLTMSEVMLLHPNLTMKNFVKPHRFKPDAIDYEAPGYYEIHFKSSRQIYRFIHTTDDFRLFIFVLPEDKRAPIPLGRLMTADEAKNHANILKTICPGWSK